PLALDPKHLHSFTTRRSSDLGTKYIWGKDVSKAVDPNDLIDTYTHNNRYTTKRFKLLVLFILAELASDYSEDELQNVVVVTGLPSQEVGTDESETLKSFLKQ